MNLLRAIADPSASLRAGLAQAKTIGMAHRSTEFTLSNVEELTADLAEALQYRPRGLG